MSTPLDDATSMMLEMEIGGIDWSSEPNTDREAQIRLRLLDAVFERWSLRWWTSLLFLGYDLQQDLGICRSDGACLRDETDGQQFASDVASMWTQAVARVRTARESAKSARRKELIRIAFGAGVDQ